MDGWHPRELGYFSFETCGWVAKLFNRIEQGAPWPHSTRSARVPFLENAGAATSHYHLPANQGMGHHETTQHDDLGQFMGIAANVCWYRRARRIQQGHSGNHVAPLHHAVALSLSRDP